MALMDFDMAKVAQAEAFVLCHVEEEAADEMMQNGAEFAMQRLDGAAWLRVSDL